MKTSFTRSASLVALGLVVSTSAAMADQSSRVTPMTPDVIDKYEQTLPSADFVRRDAMVPMRDGTKLYTVVVMKKGTSNGPILLSRTPYDAHHSTHRVLSQRIVDILEVMDAEFAEDGYIRVYQDLRGLHQAVWSGSAYLSWVYHSAVGAELILAALQHSLEEGGTTAELRQAVANYQYLFRPDLPGARALLERFGNFWNENGPTENG